MNTDKYHRQLGYLDPFKAAELPITVVGAGGIGSWTVLCLVKSGFKNITVYDFDELEEHNISNQAYSIKQLGMKKVEALNQNLEFYGEEPVKVLAERFSPGDSIDPVVIMGVDSIDARKEIFDLVKGSADLRLVIDGRMGLTTLHVYNVDMFNDDHIERYEKSLEDLEVVEMPCTARATVSTPLIMSGLITSKVVNYVNECNDTGFHEIYDTKTHHQLKIEE